MCGGDFLKKFIFCIPNEIMEMLTELSRILHKGKSEIIRESIMHYYYFKMKEMIELKKIKEEMR